MKKIISIILLSAVCFIAGNAFAQTDTVINGHHYKIVEEKTDTVVKAPVITQPVKAKEPKKVKHVPPMDSTFVINNKKLSYYNNWLTLGGGINQNLTYHRKFGFSGGLDYNFHIKQHYFQLGTFISGEKFGFYDNYEFHLGYGKRYEDKDVHFAGFVGISYSTGYGKVGDTVYTRPFAQPGIYAEVEGVKKIAYDVGIGGSLFADYNQEQGILGAKIILYFSGAYQGKRFYDGKTPE
ncbi:MAG: hypothetical protein ACJ77K_15040 [Bacteroidia bacterium]